MKKLLMGCGIMALISVTCFGGMIYWGSKVFSEVAGELQSGIQTAMNMSLDKMQQQAANVEAPDLAGKLPQISGQPVRVQGEVVDTAGLGFIPPGAVDYRTMFFLKPLVLVFSVDPAAQATIQPGKRLEILGIAAQMHLDAAPGFAEEHKVAMRQKYGSTDVPVVVMRQVKELPVLPEAPEPKKP